MTHQEIAEAVDVLLAERAESIAKVERGIGLAIEALQRQCHSVGHVFRSGALGAMPRRCAICGAVEAKAA